MIRRDFANPMSRGIAATALFFAGRGTAYMSSVGDYNGDGRPDFTSAVKLRAVAQTPPTIVP